MFFFFLLTCALSAGRLLKADIHVHNRETLLIIHTAHGLGNRLRAILSAYDHAIKSGRKLYVVWERDSHVDCLFPDLFQTDFLSLEILNGPFIPDTEAFDVYDYMGPDKYKLIDFATLKHIYVRSAYRLNSTIADWHGEGKRLKYFKPNRQTLQLISSARKKLGRNFIGVHVRNAAPDIELPSEKYLESENELRRYRRACNVSAFLQKMSQVSKSKRHFFVAADTESAKASLAREFADHVVYINNKNCNERSCDCLRYAIADLWMFQGAQHIIGSFWSSFTEMAGVLANIQPEYIGQDG